MATHEQKHLLSLTPANDRHIRTEFKTEGHIEQARVTTENIFSTLRATTLWERRTHDTNKYAFEFIGYERAETIH